MALYYKHGDLLNAPMDYICQQVNCQGRMSSGLARQIRKRWPIVQKQYLAAYNERKEKINQMCSSMEQQPDVGETLLSCLQKIKVNNKLTIINMFSQLHYGYDGARYTSYDAFQTCLEGIAYIVPKGSKIGFPYGIGCGLGGANWKVIETMIKEVLEQDYEVYIYKYEE